jgi:hypothetical protein
MADTGSQPVAKAQRRALRNAALTMAADDRVLT